MKYGCQHTFQNSLGRFDSVMRLACTGLHRQLLNFQEFCELGVKYVGSLKLTTVALVTWAASVDQWDEQVLPFGALPWGTVEHLPAYPWVD